MNPRGIIAVLLAGVFSAAALTGPAIAAVGVVVVKSTVTAERAEAGSTASVELINSGDAVTLVPQKTAVSDQACTFTMEPTNVEARQGTSIKVSFANQCFPERSQNNVVIDIDGSEPDSIPPITVKPPAATSSPWIAIAIGMLIAVVAALIFLGTIHSTYVHVRDGKVPTPSADETQVACDRRSEYDRLRASAYAAVRNRVEYCWRRLALPDTMPLNWKPTLDKRTYGLDDEVFGLDANWSIKDSWMSNLTATISAAVAIATSSQLFVALGSEGPKGPLAVMAVAGLMGVAFVAVSNTLVKIFGKPTNKVTVQGLLVANAILFGAAVFETVAVAVAVVFAVGEFANRVVFQIGLLAIAAGLIALSFWYLRERLRDALERGVPPSGVPALVLADIEEWTADIPADDPEFACERKKLLAQRITTAVGPWLRTPAAERGPQIGTPWAATGMSAGEEEWGPGEGSAIDRVDAEHRGGLAVRRDRLARVPTSAMS